MQNALRTLAVIKALALAAAPTAALAGSVSATATVSVNILAPVTLQATQGLSFGAVTKPGNAGANIVTLDPDGKVTVTGTGDATHPAGGVSAAKFSLIGQPGMTYSTSQSLTFAQSGLSNVTVSAPVAGNGTLGVIPATGAQELRYGGGFELSAATPLGAYTGALSVTVNYN